MISPLQHDYSLIKIEFKPANHKDIKVAFNDKNNSQIYIITKTGY